MNKRSIIASLLLIMLLSLSTILSVNATVNIATVPVTGTVKEEKCEGCQTSDFVSDALKSLDENTAKEESGKNYVRNFYNSTSTAITDGIDLFHPSTIPMVIFNIITYLFEMIGAMVTFFVMLIYNIASSTFITDVINNIFVNIDKIVFDWSNPNSWIMKVLVITTFMGILYQLIKNFKRMTNWKSIMELVITSFISMFLIVFIGQNGRNIMMGFEKPITSMVAQTFDFTGEKNIEIANKTNIFDILQMQPFILRNYGTTTVEGVAERFDIDVSEASNRVQTLLDDPSEDNAEKEYEDYKNNSITHDPSSASVALFLSIITLVHRIGISAVLIIILLAVALIKLAKVILLGLSVYQLIWWMIKRSNRAWQWFTDRILWCFFAIIADVFLSIALYFITSLCAFVAAKNIFLMLGVDAILIVLLYICIKNISTIMASLKDDGGAVFTAMLSANQSPLETFGGIANKHSNARKNKRDAELSNGADTNSIGNDNDSIYDENLAESNIMDNNDSNDTLSDNYDPYDAIRPNCEDDEYTKDVLQQGSQDTESHIENETLTEDTINNDNNPTNVNEQSNVNAELNENEQVGTDADTNKELYEEEQISNDTELNGKEEIDETSLLEDENNLFEKGTVIKESENINENNFVNDEDTYNQSNEMEEDLSDTLDTDDMYENSNNLNVSQERIDNEFSKGNIQNESTGVNETTHNMNQNEIDSMNKNIEENKNQIDTKKEPEVVQESVHEKAA